MLAALAHPLMRQHALEIVNQRVLDALYEFKPQAPLEGYIQTKVQEPKEVYTLREVSHMNRILMERQVLFLTDMSAFLCSLQFRKAGTQKANFLQEFLTRNA